MRDRVSTLTALAGVVASPARDGEVLVYGDAPDGERTVVAHDMQQLVATVAGWIEAEPGCAVHWHPVVLFEFSRRESYELLEAAGFDAVDVDGPAAAVHVEGPAAYVVIGPASGSPFPRDVLRAKAMVRAALYQSHGPEPLPAWAESGLAWYWAISTRDGDADDAALRRPGLRFIRNGGSVVDVLNASGSHDDDVAFDLIESIGYLAVRAMMQRDAEATAGWARDVMAGSNWRDAMESAMGRSLGRFGRELASWHRVND